MQLTEIRKKFSAWYEKNGHDPKLKDLNKLVQFLEKPEILGSRPKRTTINVRDDNGKSVYREDGSRLRVNLDGWRGWKIVNIK